MSGTTHSPDRRMRGFERTSGLLSQRIRKAGEARGFAVTRLITHWDEIAGAEIARVARPVEVSYGRQGFGATLTLITTGAQAPMLEMQKEALRERVNATYGYAAIARIRITQTAPTGFADGAATFLHKEPAPPGTDPALAEAARATASGVNDDTLRHALEALAKNVLARQKTRKP